MELIASVAADGTAFLAWPGRRVRCAIGRSGIRVGKQEGDGATPAGRFALRQAMYRPDRLAPPPTRLALRALTAADGWCDDRTDADYNRLVRLPHPVRCEALWREDALYDLLIVVGYNDEPVEPGRGSAIFIHVAKPGYAATEGCIALALPDLLDLTARCAPGDVLVTNGVAVPLR